MSPRLLITGASGYIGSRLLAVARQAGCEVIVLGSQPPGSLVPAYPWRLGEAPPTEQFAGATALVHLGHSWASDGQGAPGAANINLAGTERLARAALAAAIPRFIFASTTSARAEALNNYGRVKYAIEGRLLALPDAAGRIFCARIGLVYGGEERGQYGLMAKLTDLTPVLPMIGLDRRVQAVHIDEVCAALLRLALDPPKDRATVVVAGANPITFGAWLRTLRRARTGKRLLLIPVPIGLALLACDLTRLVPLIPTVDRERVLGLAGAAPQESAADLAALGIATADPAVKLAEEPIAQRRLLAEAAALLRYVVGSPVRAPGPIVQLARALARDPRVRPVLPALALRWPPIIRVIEPWRPSQDHRLARALHLAAMVAESLPQAQPPGPASIMAVAGQLTLDALALPFRLLLGRFYA